MENPINDLTTVNAQDGQILSVVGDTYRLVITGEQTNGAYAVIDMLVPPQGGPGPHAHARFQEAFYVLEGEVEVKTKSQTYIARKGSFINIPLGGIVHCFKNKTDTIAHLLCVVVPAGLEDFFKEIGTPVPAGTFLPPPVMSPEDQQRLQGIAEKYGQKVFPPDYLD
ncbi:MAG: cupin domain-containing protein [Nostoc sp.]|uniref:cupin domain-containing protein n=1 Tax=Nostoc sp. TaxID=1180 RepID=UPI002FF7275B